MIYLKIAKTQKQNAVVKNIILICSYILLSTIAITISMIGLITIIITPYIVLITITGLICLIIKMINDIKLISLRIIEYEQEKR